MRLPTPTGGEGGLDAGLAAALTELPLEDVEGALLATALLRAVEPLDGQHVVRRAVELAGYLHRDATRARRGRLPRGSCTTHPLRGALRLHRWDVTDLDVLVAAVLHDVVEPAFGARVAHLVAAVSNPAGPGPDDPEERRRAYREHVLAAVRSDPGVLLVKTTDLHDDLAAVEAGLAALLREPEGRGPAPRRPPATRTA